MAALRLCNWGTGDAVYAVVVVGPRGLKLVRIGEFSILVVIGAEGGEPSLVADA